MSQRWRRQACKNPELDSIEVKKYPKKMLCKFHNHYLTDLVQHEQSSHELAVAVGGLVHVASTVYV